MTDRTPHAVRADKAAVEALAQAIHNRHYTRSCLGASDLTAARVIYADLPAGWSLHRHEPDWTLVGRIRQALWHASRDGSAGARWTLQECGAEARRLTADAPSGEQPQEPDRECVCEGEFPRYCGPECPCWHHAGSDQ